MKTWIGWLGVALTALLGSGAMAMTHLAPVFVPVPAQIAKVGDLFQLTVMATDADGGDVRLTASSLPGGATFVAHANGTGTLQWSPTASQIGSYTVAFHAADSDTPPSAGALEVSISVGGELNRPPALAPIADRQIEVGTPLVIELSATDPDGDAIVYSVSPLPAGASFESRGEGEGAIAWTPLRSGRYPVTCTVTDTGAPQAAVTQTFWLTVRERPALGGARSMTVGKR